MVLASEHRAIKLPDGVDFFAWAHGQWPARRWSVELDPDNSVGHGDDDLFLRAVVLIAP